MPISSSRFPPWNLWRRGAARYGRGRGARIEMAHTSFSPHLLGKKMSDSKLGQRLPGLDEAHLCFDETHLGHVLVGFKDPG